MTYLLALICSCSLLYISNTGGSKEGQSVRVEKININSSKKKVISINDLVFVGKPSQLKATLKCVVGALPGRQCVSLSMVVAMFLCWTRHCLSSSMELMSWRWDRKKKRKGEEGGEDEAGQC